MTNIVFKAPSGSKPSKQALAYVASNDPGCGKEFNPNLCRLRHLAARLREARGVRTEYEPCAYCPHFTEPVEQSSKWLCSACGKRHITQGQTLCLHCLKNQKPEEKPMPNAMPKSETCTECQKPITAYRKHKSGLCAKCDDRQRKQEERDAKKASAERKPCPACGKLMTVNGHCFSCTAKAMGLGKRRPTPAVELPSVVITPKNPVCNEVNTKVPQEKTKGPIDKIAEAGLRRKLTEFESELTPTPKPISLKPLEQLIEKYRYERENLIALINRLTADVKQHENRLHIADMTLCDLENALEEMKP